MEDTEKPIRVVMASALRDVSGYVVKIFEIALVVALFATLYRLSGDRWAWWAWQITRFALGGYAVGAAMSFAWGLFPKLRTVGAIGVGCVVAMGVLPITFTVNRAVKIIVRNR